MLIKTKEPLFFKYIQWRLEQNKNFLCCTVGQTGSGKTYTNLKALEVLYPNKSPEELIKNTCFTPLEFLDRLNSGELKVGDGLVWDEVGVGLSSKEWQSVSNKLINHILQTFRHLNLIVLFNTPSFSFIDASSRRLFHSIWETMGINYRQKMCEVKPLLLQMNSRSGDIYYKYLRVNDAKHGVVPVTRIYFSLPSKRLRELYEIKKSEFTTMLNKRIYEELRDIDAKRGKTKELTPYQEEIMGLVNQGLTHEQIAVKFNVTRQAIQQAVSLIKRKGAMVGLKPSKPQKTP